VRLAIIKRPGRAAMRVCRRNDPLYAVIGALVPGTGSPMMGA
jgi:hypothetical protein